MADFETAFAAMQVHEGGHAAHALDHGGETYCGIARNYYPDWAGWPVIDVARDGPDFPRNLDATARVQEMVRVFYRREYWNTLLGDAIADQAVANELFDTAVNLGARRAVRYVQRGLNALNRDERDYPDLEEDGLMGPQTLAALDAYLDTERRGRLAPPHNLLKIMNILQGMHYLAFLRSTPAQEAFARGWLQRVDLCKV